MLVDKVLIAAKLGCVVASHRMQIIGSAGLVEGIGSKVHHPEIPFILEYLLLVRLHLEVAVVLLCAHPVVIAEEALVHRPQVSEHQNSERGNERSIFELVRKMQREHSGSQRNENERTPGIGPQHRGTLIIERIHKPLRHPAQGMRIIA